MRVSGTLIKRSTPNLFFLKMEVIKYMTCVLDIGTTCASGKMTKERMTSVTISAEANRTLKSIALRQNLMTYQGNPSRAKALEYLIKNFEAPIA